VIKINKRPQWLAAAWLRETGEHRPALDVLRSGDEVKPLLRAALADWIASGCKRRKGSKVPVDPWREYPPRLARSQQAPTTAKERHAWIEFELYLLANIGARDIAATPSKRGRPISFEGRAIAAVAKQVGISERTAREWFDRFFPNGYA
jgi:hypothetical protein